MTLTELFWTIFLSVVLSTFTGHALWEIKQNLHRIVWIWWMERQRKKQIKECMTSQHNTGVHDCLCCGNLAQDAPPGMVHINNAVYHNVFFCTECTESLLADEKEFFSTFHKWKGLAKLRNQEEQRDADNGA